jgi:hypothetical protein
MAKWALLVDPVTGGFVIEDGGFKRCGPGIAAAVNAVCTEIGSVPDAPDLGTDPSPTHVSESTPRDEERRIDKALRGLRGLDFDNYERETGWDTAGNPVVLIRVYRGGVEEKITIPVG